ncbi:ATP-dependent DNA ligase, partial [Candidatus Bathyarchaeota archaeon]|nr:ATP-dependent DNA ligase [Candidatus Bathyarchaeota archaeon]
MPTDFKALAELCEKVENTSKRNLMVKMVADFLKSLEPSEIEPAVSMILGRPLPRGSEYKLNINWTAISKIIRRLAGISWSEFVTVLNKTGDVGSAVKEILEKSKVRKQALLLQNPLTIMEVKRRFEAISESAGQGSRGKKERLLESLLSITSPLEAKYLVKILIGEMRTGFHEGLMEQALSEAFQISLNVIQNASMVLGDVAYVAAIARLKGKDALLNLGFRIFRPIKPMLAQMAEDVAEALKEHGGKTAFEYKLDGARVQIHKKGNAVKIFSRRLTDVTESLPDVTRFIKVNVKAEEAILEGEVIAVDKDERPMAFQHLMRRFKRVRDVEAMTQAIPVRLYFFDIIYLNGENL